MAKGCVLRVCSMEGVTEVLTWTWSALGRRATQERTSWCPSWMMGLSASTLTSWKTMWVRGCSAVNVIQDSHSSWECSKVLKCWQPGLKVGENLKHRVLAGLWKSKVWLCKFCCCYWLLYVYVLHFFHFSFFIMYSFVLLLFHQWSILLTFFLQEILENVLS